MEGAVSDTHESSHFSVVSVLAVTLQKGQGGNEIAFFHEMVRVW